MGLFKDLDDAKEYFKGEKFATSSGMHIDELLRNRRLLHEVGVHLFLLPEYAAW